MKKFNKYDSAAIEKKRIENEKEARDLLNNLHSTFTDDPAVLAEAFAFSSNFYTYSPRNTQLIYAQNRGATYCQSYADWKKMGYNVQAGETGLKVWVKVEITLLEINDREYVQLSKATPEQKAAYDNGDINAIKKMGFKIGHVFDISQTNFPKEKYPELFYMGYDSSLHLEICRAIEDFSQEKLQCPVFPDDLHSISLRGLYSPEYNYIKINNRLNDTQRLCTTLHETSHAIIHSKPSQKSAIQKELEADALAIMFQSNLGVELTDSRKRHFSDHFDRYMEECQDKGKNPDDSINDVFKNVYDIYRDHIQDINGYVNKRISIDQTQLPVVHPHLNSNVARAQKAIRLER